MATIKTSFMRSVFPPHFFPIAPPAMKALLWQSLTDQHLSVREAMVQFLGDTLQTSIAAEFADMMIEDYEKSWNDYRAVEALKSTRA